MFSIYDGRGSFFQWDLNQKVVIDKKCDEVHFAVGNEILTTKVQELMGEYVADVPNIFLQKPGTMTVYAYMQNDTESAPGYTMTLEYMRIVARPKPASYVYTETEVRTWGQLDASVQAALSLANEAVKKATEPRVHVGPDEPTDENVEIWVDTDEEPPKQKLSDFENDCGYFTEDNMPEIPEAPQADWAQNDETAADYIKNRLVYKTYEQGVVFEANVTAEQQKVYYNKFGQNLIAGETYEVIWNGQSYVCVATAITLSGEQGIGIGNFYVIGGANTGEPFLIGDAADFGQIYVVNLTGAEATVTINGKIEKYHRIDGYEPFFDVHYIDVIYDEENDTYTTTTTPREIIPLVNKGKQIKLRIFKSNYAGERHFADLFGYSACGQSLYFMGYTPKIASSPSHWYLTTIIGDGWADTPYSVGV